MNSGFAFSLKQRVILVESSEKGTVIGRGEFSHSENTYLVRYRAGDGRQIDEWWGESALNAL